jgi:four helix bundle protein
MRDHSKLRVFAVADELAIDIYRLTNRFPQSEVYGLVSQMRRAAVSVPANIVEGCARATQADFLHFLHIALGSARELDYLTCLSGKLGFLDTESLNQLSSSSDMTCRLLNSLIQSIRSRT